MIIPRRMRVNFARLQYLGDLVCVLRVGQWIGYRYIEYETMHNTELYVRLTTATDNYFKRRG